MNLIPLFMRIRKHLKYMPTAEVNTRSTDYSPILSSCAHIVAAEEMLAQAEWSGLHNYEILERVCTLYPDKVAIRTRSMVLTYAELSNAISQVSSMLLARGIPKGATVLVCGRRSYHWIVAMFAIWRTGNCYVPVDPLLPRERVELIRRDCNAAAVMTEPEFVHLFEDFEHRLPIEGTAVQSEGKLETSVRRPSKNDIAYSIYTSGTTGKPKGVQIEHCCIPPMALEHQISGELVSDDVVCLFSSFSFDASLRDVHGALLCGATLYVPDDDEISLQELCHTLEREDITYLVITPTVLNSVEFSSVSALRTLVVAGEAADRALIRRWGKGRRLINAYGPTECTVCTTKKVYFNGNIAETDPISIGTPTLGMAAFVVREDGMRASLGEIGELHITGLGVSNHGYKNDTELSETKFGSGNSPNQRFYRSGDRCRVLENGEFEWIDRIDSQVKIYGRRIELEDIRACLMTLAAVKDVAVLIDRECMTPHIIAFILPTQIGSLCDLTLRDSIMNDLSMRLPQAMLPQQLVVLPHWPTNHAAKIDTGELLRQARSIRSSSVAVSYGDDDLATITHIWNEVLGTQSERLRDDATFNKLGGRSIGVQLMLSRVYKRLGVMISFTSFVRNGQTVSALLELIHRARAAGLAHNKLPIHEFERSDLDSELAVYQSRKVEKSDGVLCLLTGATGFFGAHILASLLKKGRHVVCLVRANDAADAHRRIRENMSRLGLWHARFSGQFESIVGNIEEARLSLSEVVYSLLGNSITHVYHCAADVDFLKPYEQLKGANVIGTNNLLDFTRSGSGPAKVFNLVSTLATFFSSGYAGPGEEEANAQLSKRIIGGYAQSKWVAEQLAVEARQQGMLVNVFRPGRLLGSSRVGICPANDMYVRLLQSLMLLGVAPDIEFAMDLTPADVAAEHLVQISDACTGAFHHLLDNQTVTLSEVVSFLHERGYTITTIPYDQWKMRLLEEDAIAIMGPLVSIFTGTSANQSSLFDLLLDIRCYRTGRFSNERTVHLTNKLSDQNFPGWRRLLSKYLDVWEQSTLSIPSPVQVEQAPIFGNT